LSEIRAGRSKKKVVGNLLESHQIVGLLETKAGSEDQCRWAHQWGGTHLVFTEDAQNDTAGGILVLVSKKVAELPGMQVRFRRC
jgi:hypothetical protein